MNIYLYFLMKHFPGSGIFLIRSIIRARIAAPKNTTKIENPILNPTGNDSYE